MDQKCNELRKANGLDELKVNDYLMAVSQYSANASAYTMEHIRQFGVGENLAWGWTEHFGGPFAGWYDEEKNATRMAVPITIVGII